MRSRLFVIAIMWVSVFAGAFSARAQSDTAFTYQGVLQDDGGPANGTFNVDVTLWDAATGGSQLGSPVMFNSLPVNDGLITVELDFGLDIAAGGGRWLEFSINGTELAPRQQIAFTPYSIQTRGIFVDETGRVGIGTTTPIKELHVAGDTASLRLEGTAEPGGYSLFEDSRPTQLRIGKHNANGDALLDFNPAPDDGTSTALVRFFRETNTTGIKGLRLYRGDNTASASAIIGVDGQDSAFQLHGGNLGIGVSTPTAKLQVETAVNQIGLQVQSPNNAIYGTCVGDFRTGVTGHGLGVVGGTGVQGTAFGEDGVGVSGHANSSTGVNIGVRGSSNSAEGFDFFAAGPGQNYGSFSSVRWKSNIEPIPDPLGKLARLRGVYFDWDAEHGGHHDLGMIAEEVGAVLPEIVAYETNGIDAIGMDYSKLGPLLVQAVNALRTEKDAQINAQAAQIRELEDRLAAMELLMLELKATASGPR